jgi:uncharacterized protein (DUF608 family)
MKKYSGRNLDLVSFPLGGIGAGMMCIEGNGSFGSVSIRNTPDVNLEPNIFSAITVLGKENISRVVEAPVAKYKIFTKEKNSGNGLFGKNYGLPRFSKGEFSARFPFATVKLTDEILPVVAEIKSWSPFIPNDENRSGLPFVGVEYTFLNITNEDIEVVYYFNASNFMKIDDNSRVRPVKNGFILEQDGTKEAAYNKGAFSATVEEDAFVDTAWFRGGWFDTLTMLWNDITKGSYKNKVHSDLDKGQSLGGTIAVPFTLKGNESKTIKLRFSWFVPDSKLRYGDDGEKACSDSNCCSSKKNEQLPKYKPWYTTVISSIDHGDKMWSENYNSMYKDTKQFTDCFYDSILPEEILDAVSTNLSILKSPTILRQTDGRIWAWEGCCDIDGCCAGTCTHVWNYAQALCNLFPTLERGLRQTEFYEAQDELTGHQNFRASLPIRKSAHDFHAASDGQLGGIIKVYRDWKISGDNQWLKGIWKKVKQSLNYCISKWDIDKEGILKQPHHNTYDIEFWGPDGMCTSFYLGALKAAFEMGKAMGEECTEYIKIYGRGKKYVEERLFNDEYFYQQVMRDGLSVPLEYSDANNETKELLEKEGPKYQYGTGCISDGILGVWLSEVSGLSDILEDEKVKKNLQSIYKYNFKTDLSAHANPQRPGYAIGKEAGLLLCTWPKGGKPSLPFVYSDEVWTGIEYQVASHLLLKGYVKEGLDIVRGCRNRYDGIIRNPYNEYECGHWYARAMASYALLQTYTGVRFDNVTKTLYAKTNNSNNYKTFLSTATGYGNVEMINGKIKVTVVSGNIEINDIVID